MLELTKLEKPETKRTYTFPGGEKVVIDNVTHFLARESGTHRLKTANGRLHVVPTGWVHIEIDASDFSL